MRCGYEPIDKLFDQIHIGGFAIIAQLASAVDQAGMLSSDTVAAIDAHLVAVAKAAEACDQHSDVLPFLSAAIELFPARR
jgi:hypothetical protein